MDLYSEFEWRGLVYDATDGLKERFDQPDMIAYAGFDPTASSLHVGSLLPIMALARLERAGHRPIAVVGGGTGLIGDPSGKTTERQLLTAEQVEANVHDIRSQLARFLDLDSKNTRSKLVNNLEWLGGLGALELMRDTGKHFTVNYMLAKDSIKRRVESKDGISYTEFSYLLLQAYDFLQLYNRYGCTVQMGGSDQWGNITAGIELIRKATPAGSSRAYGLVVPLVLTAAGSKFGKTEEGTVWLDPKLTRPYEFYQFWLNTDDRDAVRYLKFFTFLSQETIADFEVVTAREPEGRHAQRALAQQVTELVHGADAVREAEAAARVLFSGDVSGLSVDQLLRVFPSVPSSAMPFVETGWPITELLVSSRVTASKGEATRLIRNGGIYVNGRRVTDEKLCLRPDDAVEGQLFVVRKGKRDNFLVRIIDA
ncbi:MAG: tyrosine--tRNA ligase [Acidobacteria bacterium]|nr:tyrosine--tRNA ligase [Acidobacteriota bacterium]